MSNPQSAAGLREKIDAVIASIEPKEGRQSRLGHISIEDFAELLGAKPSRVHTWRRTRNPAEPSPEYRAKLAELSGGRYQPDDFRKPRDPQGRPEEWEVLLAELAALDSGQEEQLTVLSSHSTRLEALDSSLRELRSGIEARLDALTAAVQRLADG